MDESAGTLPSDPGSIFYVPTAELSNETIDAKLKAIMNDGEVTNVIAMDQANYGLQLEKELHRQASEAELSEETASVNVETVLKANEVENVISVGETTCDTQLVEELKQQDNEAGLTIAPADFIDKLIVSNSDSLSIDDEVENITSTGEKTYVVQLVEDVIQQESESELSIPAIKVSEKLMVANMETISKDGEVENNISTEQATNGLLLVEEMHQQENETKIHDEGIAANVKTTLNDVEVENSILTQATYGPQQNDETEMGFPGDNSVLVTETQLQVDTLNDGKVLIIEEEKVAKEFHEQMREWDAQKYEKTKLKLTLDEKRTEIAVEVEELKAKTDQKLKKIDEIVKQEESVGAEIAHMKSQCSESKCKHAMFIDLFKLIVESGLPLSAHREIKLLIDKEDKAAQKLLSKAMELETGIEARAKLKLTLHEERAQIAEQVEALKLQIDQKLKEASEVDKLQEALDSEIAHIESQCSDGELRCARSCLKRKAHDGPLPEELSPSETRAKRINLDTADSSQERVHDVTVI